MGPLPEDHAWVLRAELPTFQSLVEVMDVEGWDWVPDRQKFVPRRGGGVEGHLPLDVKQALAHLDPKWIDRSGDVRNLPPPKWPPWL